MFDSVIKPIVELLNSILTPMLAIVFAVGSLYCVVLGVKYAKAEEPQDREKAKGALKNAIIGFVLIFVLILALKILMPNMIEWVNKNAGNQQIINPNSIVTATPAGSRRRGKEAQGLSTRTHGAARAGVGNSVHHVRFHTTANNRVRRLRYEAQAFFRPGSGCGADGAVGPEQPLAGPDDGGLGSDHRRVRISGPHHHQNDGL